MHHTRVVIWHIVGVDLCAIILPKVVFCYLRYYRNWFLCIYHDPSLCARGGIQAYAWAHVALSLSKIKRNITLQGCFITFIQLQNKYRLIKAVNSWPIQSIVVFTYICTRQHISLCIYWSFVMMRSFLERWGKLHKKWLNMTQNLSQRWQ